MVNAAKADQKSVLQIKQDDKFFCRLLSKESSMSNPSFRVAAAVAVPFVWESQPGTPKYTFSEDTLPPLTPPPSYHFNTTNACKRPAVKKIRPSRFNNFMALLPKLNLKKIILSASLISSSSPPSSLSCSSSSWWSSSDSSSKVVPMAKLGRRRFLSYSSSSFDLRGDHNEEDGGGSPSSTLCFGIPRATSSNSGFLSSYRRKA